MKFTNLFQDPESDSEAPYADTFVLDAGGLDVKYGGDTLAHVSFEDLDPFEIAFHAMPDDWEPHPEWDEMADYMFIATPDQVAENSIYRILNELGRLKGWVRS